MPCLKEEWVPDFTNPKCNIWKRVCSVRGQLGCDEGVWRGVPVFVTRGHKCGSSHLTLASLFSLPRDRSWAQSGDPTAPGEGLRPRREKGGGADRAGEAEWEEPPRRLPGLGSGGTLARQGVAGLCLPCSQRKGQRGRDSEPTSACCMGTRRQALIPRTSTHTCIQNAHAYNTSHMHRSFKGPTSRLRTPTLGSLSSPRGRKVRESHSTQTPLPGERGPGCPEAGPEALPWPYNERCLLSRPLAYLRHPSLRAPSLLTLPPSCFLGSRPAALTQACSPARGRPGSRASLQPCCCNGSLLTIPFHPPFFNSRQKRLS